MSQSATSDRPVGARAGWNYRIIVSAMGISSFGDWTYRLALPIAVLRLTRSADATALMYALEYVPYIVWGPFAGALGNTPRRRSVLVGTQAMATVIAGILALLEHAHHVDFWAFLALGFALSSSQTVFYPVFQRTIQMAVSGDWYIKVNARLQLFNSLFGALGPAVGTLVVSNLGVAGAIGVDALSFGIAGLFLAGLFLPGRVSVPMRPDDASDIDRVGWRAVTTYFRAQREVFLGVLLFSGTSFGLMIVEANLIYLVIHRLHLFMVYAGIILGAGGAGSILGALMAPRIARRWSTGVIIVGTMGLAGLLTLGMVVPLWPIMAVAWLGVSGFVTVMAVSWFTFQQATVPGPLLGAVASMGRAISYAAIPLGAILGGLLVSTVNAWWPLAVIGGGAQLAMAAIGRWSPLWNARVRDAKGG